MTAKEIIDYYTLLPHPEGGYYRRTYASALDTNLRGKIVQSAPRFFFSLNLASTPVCTAFLRMRCGIFILVTRCGLWRYDLTEKRTRYSWDMIYVLIRNFSTLFRADPGSVRHLSAKTASALLAARYHPVFLWRNCSLATPKN